MSIPDYIISCRKNYQEYISGILSGSIPANKWIRLAVERHLRDKENPELNFREDLVERVLKFFYFCKIPIGNHFQQFRPLPWQCFLIYSIFGPYKGDRRQYRYLYLMVAKKNGKSTLAALLQLYFLLGDGVIEPHSILCALTREQAQICLSYANSIILNSPMLSARLSTQRNKIIFKDSKKGGFCKTVSSAAGRLHGYNISGAVLDEAGGMETDELFNVVKSSTIYRDNPMTILITTAYPSIRNLGYELFTAGRKVLEGDMADPQFFYMLYTLDPEDSWHDNNLWIKSNPSLGGSLDKDNLIGEYNTNKNTTTGLQNFITMNLNVFTESLGFWIPENIMQEAVEEVDWSSFDGQSCWAGIDLSSTRDLTALSLVFPRDEKIYIKTYFFMANNPDKRIRQGGVDLQPWIDKGWIHLCKTPTIDYDYLYEFIMSLSEKYRIEALYYDRFNSALLIPRLQDKIPCKGFQQIASRFNAPLKHMEKLFFDGNLKIDDNKAFLWNLRNVVIWRDSNDNIKILKNRSNDSVDGAVAAAMGLGAFLDGTLMDGIYETIKSLN